MIVKACLFGLHQCNIVYMPTLTKHLTMKKEQSFTRLLCLAIYSLLLGSLHATTKENTQKEKDIMIYQCIHTLRGHEYGVNSVVFAPDGKTFASASDDRSIKLWNTDTGICLYTLQGHMGEVSSICYAPKGQRLASASYDASLKVWNTSTGTCLFTLQGHTNIVWDICYAPDGKTFASASFDGTIKIWHATTGQCLRTLQGHNQGVSLVCYAPDGKRLISASLDRCVKVWNTNTGQCLGTLQKHTYPILSISYAPDGVTFASGSGDSLVRLWDVNTGTCVRTLYGHTSDVHSLAYAPDTEMSLVFISGYCRQYAGKQYVPNIIVNLINQYTRRTSNILASAGSDNVINIWNTSTGAWITTLQGHTTYVLSVAFAPNGKTLASASNRGVIKIWQFFD